jgi:lipopolysaccharide export system permease protein
MAVVDRYILKQIAKPILTAIAIGLLVLLAERMVRLLDVTLGKRNSFGVVFELLTYLLPHYLGLAIPVALFLGLLFGFNRLSRDSEIDAFLASGVGLHRLIRPVVMLAFVLTCISLVIFGWLQPYARSAYRNVLFTVKNVEVFYLAEEGVFMQAGTRTFILDSLSRVDGSFQKIFLFDNRGAKGSETITAASGRLVPDPTGQRPILHLEKGHRIELPANPNHGTAGPPPAAVVGDFAFADTPLGKLSERLMRKRGIDERELTLPELFGPRTNLPEGISANSMDAELNGRLVNIAGMMLLPILALPFAIGRRRHMRAYRFGVAVALLIGYHEVIQQGALITENAGTTPILTIWLPFAALSFFAAWRFWNVCFSVRADRLDPFFDRLALFFSSVRRRLLPQFESRS